MEQSQLFSELKTALSGCDGVWADEAKTELAHNLLLDKLDKHDVAILTALLDNSVLKRHFFTQVGDAWVFKQQDFQFFLSQRKISHSYTRFKNRIGLTDGTRFLKDSTDIVLDFPFKDCVLSGGQSSEEREECYFERNSGIGSDRIGSDRQQPTRKKRANVKKFSLIAFSPLMS